MSPFDAIAHSLSTLPTGGFSTHDARIGYYQSPGIEAVAIVFMLLAVIGMLLGRLEILTILVILSPGFWAR